MPLYGGAMKSPLFRLLPFVVLLLPLHAQSDKAQNFYEALRKRPSATALFDQFYNAWLDTGTVEELETFLTGEAEKSPEARMILAEYYARQGALDKSSEAWRADRKSTRLNSSHTVISYAVFCL